ncbi:tRNA (adenine(22)-N(1))-methyltransferase TrmK [Sulfobacillus thermosulfidooxidans]|uniref:tRNA (adenine(22)-N(1))-methyltransferase TrmK n=1 Tax=Sulfobacillus thermosulfidooxidans TaxID=28034 RepID=UPI0006B42C66|nr:tRNA (adenine(22)-N(1))-methyltransferase TrmK [Sulfobacillus thermosulfidooxidans]
MAPLEKRLMVIRDWCKPFTVVADVGAGQGRLARALAEQGQQVYATEKTLKGWQELTSYTRPFFPRITPVLGDGIIPLLSLSTSIDVAVIAGMGPRTIQHILRQDSENLTIQSFIIQPMQGLFPLRRYLLENRWSISRAELVKEHDKIYGMWLVQRVAKGEIDEHSPFFWIPQEFQHSPLFPCLIRQRLAQLNQSIDHADKDDPKLQAWQRETQYLTGVIS